MSASWCLATTILIVIVLGWPTNVWLPRLWLDSLLFFVLVTSVRIVIVNEYYTIITVFTSVVTEIVLHHSCLFTSVKSVIRPRCRTNVIYLTIELLLILNLAICCRDFVPACLPPSLLILCQTMITLRIFYLYLPQIDTVELGNIMKLLVIRFYLCGVLLMFWITECWFRGISAPGYFRRWHGTDVASITSVVGALIYLSYSR